MNCIKCNAALEPGAGFCLVCGQNQKIPVKKAGNLEKNSIFSPKMAGILLAGGLVVVAVSVAAILLLRSPQVVLAKASQKTLSQLEEDGVSMLESMPVYDFFKDWFDMPYSMIYQSDDGKFAVETDYGRGQMKVTLEMTELVSDPLFFYASHDFITMEYQDILLGINNKTLAYDLSNCSYLDVYLDEGYVFDPFSYNMNSFDVFIQASTVALTELLTQAEVEKRKEKTSLQLDGKTRDVDVFEVYISSQNLRTALKQVLEEVLSNPENLQQLEQTFFLNSIGTKVEEGDFQRYLAEIRSEGENYINEIVASYAGGNSEIFLAYVYDNCLVGLANATAESGVTLGNTKNPWEEITLYDGLETLGFSLSLAENVLKFDMFNADGEEISLTYDYNASQDNLCFSDGSENIYFSLDSTQSGKLKMFDSNFTDQAIFEKNNLSTDWFQQNQDFEPILSYSEMEMMGLLFRFYF